MKLSAVQEKFILHWGEMGTRWGVNRTVAQVHALLYLWPTALNAEQITELLATDPRPAYRRGQEDDKEYGALLFDFNIRWAVKTDSTLVLAIDPAAHPTG